MRGFLKMLLPMLLIVGPLPAAASEDCPSSTSGDGLLRELRQTMAARAPGCVSVDVMPLDAIWLSEIDASRHSFSNLSVSADGTTFAAAVVERAAGGASRVARVVRGRISQLQLVPVSSRRIMPGERVSAGDIRMVHLDIRQVPPNAITVARELEGLEPRWPVAPNAVMTRAQLKAPAMIERGDIVTAEYRANNIELTTKVIADESGSRGQVIRVRNPSSNKTIQGRISDVARVTID